MPFRHLPRLLLPILCFFLLLLPAALPRYLGAVFPNAFSSDSFSSSNHPRVSTPHTRTSPTLFRPSQKPRYVHYRRFSSSKNILRFKARNRAPRRQRTWANTSDRLATSPVSVLKAVLDESPSFPDTTPSDSPLPSTSPSQTSLAIPEPSVIAVTLSVSPSQSLLISPSASFSQLSSPSIEPSSSVPSSSPSSSSSLQPNSVSSSPSPSLSLSAFPSAVLSQSSQLSPTPTLSRSLLPSSSPSQSHAFSSSISPPLTVSSSWSPSISATPSSSLFIAPPTSTPFSSSSTTAIASASSDETSSASSSPSESSFESVSVSASASASALESALTLESESATASTSLLQSASESAVAASASVSSSALESTSGLGPELTSESESIPALTSFSTSASASESILPSSSIFALVSVSESAVVASASTSASVSALGSSLLLASVSASAYSIGLVPGSPSGTATTSALISQLGLISFPPTESVSLSATSFRTTTATGPIPTFPTYSSFSSSPFLSASASASSSASMSLSVLMSASAPLITLTSPSRSSTSFPSTSASGISTFSLAPLDPLSTSSPTYSLLASTLSASVSATPSASDRTNTLSLSQSASPSETLLKPISIPVSASASLSASTSTSASAFASAFTSTTSFKSVSVSASASAFSDMSSPIFEAPTPSASMSASTAFSSVITASSVLSPSLLSSQSELINALSVSPDTSQNDWPHVSPHVSTVESVSFSPSATFTLDSSTSAIPSDVFSFESPTASISISQDFLQGSQSHLTTETVTPSLSVDADNSVPFESPISSSSQLLPTSSQTYMSPEITSTTSSLSQTPSFSIASQTTIPFESGSHETGSTSASTTLPPAVSTSSVSHSPTSFATALDTASTSVRAFSLTPSESTEFAYSFSSSPERSVVGDISKRVDETPDPSSLDFQSLSASPFIAPSLTSAALPSLPLPSSTSSPFLDQFESYDPQSSVSVSSSLQNSPLTHLYSTSPSTEISITGSMPRALIASSSSSQILAAATSSISAPTFSVSSSSNNFLSLSSSLPPRQNTSPSIEPNVSYPLLSSASALPSLAPSFSASTSAISTYYPSSPFNDATASHSLDFTVSLDGEETPLLTSNSKNPLISDSVSNTITPLSSFTSETPVFSRELSPSTSYSTSSTVLSTFISNPSLSSSEPTETPSVYEEPSDPGKFYATPLYSHGMSSSLAPSYLDPIPSVTLPKVPSESPEVSQGAETNLLRNSAVGSNFPSSSQYHSPDTPPIESLGESHMPSWPINLSNSPSGTFRRSPSQSKGLTVTTTPESSLLAISPSDEGSTIRTPIASTDVPNEHNSTPSATSRGIGDRPKGSPPSEAYIPSLTPSVSDSGSKDSPTLPPTSLTFSGENYPPDETYSPSLSQQAFISTAPSIIFETSVSPEGIFSPALTVSVSPIFSIYLSQSPSEPSLLVTTVEISPSETILSTIVAPSSTTTNSLDETLAPSAWSSSNSPFVWSASTSLTTSLSPDISPIAVTSIEPSPSKVTPPTEPSSSHEVVTPIQESAGSHTWTPPPFPSISTSPEIPTPSRVTSSPFSRGPRGFSSESLEPLTTPSTITLDESYSVTPSMTFSPTELLLTPAVSISSAPGASNDLMTSTDGLNTPALDASDGFVTAGLSFTPGVPGISVSVSPVASGSSSVAATSLRPSVSATSTASMSRMESSSVPFETLLKSPSVSPEYPDETPDLLATESEVAAIETFLYGETPVGTGGVSDASSSYDPDQSPYMSLTMVPSDLFSPSTSYDVRYTSEPSLSFEIGSPAESYTQTAEQTNDPWVSFSPSFSFEASSETSTPSIPSFSLIASLSNEAGLSSETAALTPSEEIPSEEAYSPEASSLTLTPTLYSPEPSSLTLTPTSTHDQGSWTSPYVPSTTEILIDPSPSIDVSHAPSDSPSITEDLPTPTVEAETTTTSTGILSEEPLYSYSLSPLVSSSNSALSSLLLDSPSPNYMLSPESSAGTTDEMRESASATPSALISYSEQSTVESSPEFSPTEESNVGSGFGIASATASPSRKTKSRPTPPQRPRSKSPTPSKGSIVKNPTPTDGNSGASDSAGGGASDNEGDDFGDGNGSLPLGIGGTSAVAIVSIVVFLAVIVVAYKTCAVIPSGSGFSMPSIFGSSDDENASGEGSEFGFGPGAGDDSPWDQVWQNASDLPEGAQREGEAAAAQVGGQFAGLLKPGGSRVRPPQVITRLAIPGMFTTLSQLSPDTGSSVMSVTTGFSYDPTSQEGSRLHDGIGLGGNDTINHVEKEKLDLAALTRAADAPKVDLLFVFDASGSLSWRDYRRVKEVITKPHGLIDEITLRAHDASRIGFIEYAYDSVVVSELDREKDSVRRRILSSFQGDANNWDEQGMYIYEVGSTDGGNVLRKVSSVVQKEEKSKKSEESDNIESEPGSVNVKEVPPAMNGMSREVHLALKWSRFEMLPPVANKRIQAQLQNTVRRRRVIVVNGGEFTKGGHSSGGVEAAVTERKEMERVGIRVITVGIGEDSEKELGRVGSRRHHVAVDSVEEFEAAIERITRLVMAADNRNDRLFKLPGMGVLKRRQREGEDNSATKFRRKGDINPVGTDAIKTISKGLPRRASELPPWYTDGLE